MSTDHAARLKFIKDVRLAGVPSLADAVRVTDALIVAGYRMDGVTDPDALVEQTAALVEAQRVANLLAFVAQVQAGLAAGEKPNAVVLDRAERAGQQIVEGLGLS